MLLEFHFLKKDLFYVYKCFTSVHVYIPPICPVPWVPEEGTGSPGMELHVVVSLYVGAGS